MRNREQNFVFTILKIERRKRIVLRISQIEKRKRIFVLKISKIEKRKINGNTILQLEREKYESFLLEIETLVNDYGLWPKSLPTKRAHSTGPQTVIRPLRLDKFTKIILALRCASTAM